MSSNTNNLQDYSVTILPSVNIPGWPTAADIAVAKSGKKTPQLARNCAVSLPSVDLHTALSTYYKTDAGFFPYAIPDVNECYRIVIDGFEHLKRLRDRSKSDKSAFTADPLLSCAKVPVHNVRFNFVVIDCDFDFMPSSFRSSITNSKWTTLVNYQLSKSAIANNYVLYETRGGFRLICKISPTHKEHFRVLLAIFRIYFSHICPIAAKGIDWLVYPSVSFFLPRATRILEGREVETSSPIDLPIYNLNLANKLTSIVTILKEFKDSSPEVKSSCQLALDKLDGKLGKFNPFTISEDGKITASPKSAESSAERLQNWTLEAIVTGVVNADLVKTKFSLPSHIPSGERNSTLFTYAVSLLANTTNINEVITKLLKANNELCEDPVSTRELTNIIKSAAKLNNRRKGAEQADYSAAISKVIPPSTLSTVPDTSSRQITPSITNDLVDDLYSSILTKNETTLNDLRPEKTSSIRLPSAPTDVELTLDYIDYGKLGDATPNEKLRPLSDAITAIQEEGHEIAYAESEDRGGDTSSDGNINYTNAKDGNGNLLIQSTDPIHAKCGLRKTPYLQMFMHYSEVVLAKWVASELTDSPDMVDLVAERGNIWKYSEDTKTWKVLSNESLISLVCTLDQSVIYKNTMRGPSVSKAIVGIKTAKCVVEMLYSMLMPMTPVFEKQVRKGVVFNDKFVFTSENSATIHVKTPEASDYCTMRIDGEYTEDEPLLFNKFLEICMASQHSSEKIQFIWEFLGVALLGQATEMQTAMILLGKGENGKSTLIRVMAGLFPEDRVTSISPKDMENEYRVAMLSTSYFNQREELANKSFSMGSEDKLKGLIDGALETGRHIRGSPFTFKPLAAQAFALNRLPRFGDFTHGFLRKFVIINMLTNLKRVLTPDRHFHKKILKKERSMIASKALREGSKALLRGYYTVPENSDLLKMNWRRQNDQVALFIDQSCKSTTDKVKAIPLPTLYSMYKVWCNMSGFNAINVSDFQDRLELLNVPEVADSKPLRLYLELIN